MSEEEELEADIRELKREQHRCFVRIEDIDDELIDKLARLNEIRGLTETGER